jgi:hypothetical protein
MFFPNATGQFSQSCKITGEEITVLHVVKGKAFPDKSWRFRVGMECWTSFLTLIFGTTRTADLINSVADRGLPEGNLLVLISVTELLNVDRLIRSLEYLQRPHRESNPARPVL